MDILNKNHPAEALKVATYTASHSPRKRRFGSKRLQFNDSYIDSQCIYRFPVSVITGLTQPLANDSRTPIEILEDAGRVSRPEGRVSNEVLLRNEFNTRNQLHANSHSLAYSLRLYEFTKMEHDGLIQEIGLRQLSVLEDPHV